MNTLVLRTVDGLILSVFVLGVAVCSGGQRFGVSSSVSSFGDFETCRAPVIPSLLSSRAGRVSLFIDRAGAMDGGAALAEAAVARRQIQVGLIVEAGSEGGGGGQRSGGGTGPSRGQRSGGSSEPVRRSVKFSENFFDTRRLDVIRLAFAGMSRDEFGKVARKRPCLQ